MNPLWVRSCPHKSRHSGLEGRSENRKKIMTHKEKAQKLLESGFVMYGYGNFDLSTDEIANILELIEDENFEEVGKLYELLSEVNL